MGHHISTEIQVHLGKRTSRFHQALEPAIDPFNPNKQGEYMHVYIYIIYLFIYIYIYTYYDQEVQVEIPINLDQYGML